MKTQSSPLKHAIRFGIFGLIGGIVLALIVRAIIVGTAPTITHPGAPAAPTAPTYPTAKALPTAPTAPSTPVYPSPPVEPQLEQNSIAYWLLQQGINSGLYAELKDKTDKAYSMSTDQSLTYITTWFSKAAALMLNSGLEKFTEQNSIPGFIKLFISGYVNPMNGIEGVYLIAQAKLGDFQQHNANIDAVYPPRIAAFQVAYQKYQQEVQDYNATVQRLKSEYDTAMQQYERALQDYNATVQQIRQEYEMAVQRYPQQMAEYQAALQRYTSEYQAWQQTTKDAAEKDEHNAANATHTANIWFWIVLAAVPVTLALYGGTAVSTNAPDKHIPPVITPDNGGNAATAELVSIHVESIPAGAEVLVDGDFIGNTPADLKISKGKHVLRLEKQDCQKWERSISAVEGMKLSLTLEKV